jgi:hypothetical protein
MTNRTYGTNETNGTDKSEGKPASGGQYSLGKCERRRNHRRKDLAMPSPVVAATFFSILEPAISWLSFCS